MRAYKYLQIAFLIAGAFAVLEFIFIRGMFTWLIAVAAVAVIGVLNVIASVKNKELLLAALYSLSTIALCMGYISLA